ncbi:MAG: spore coat associated protein CotJA [Clostridiales bacterium]|nr:spore coat associated protein CotJA [Clostridiales bacterium]
MNCNTRNYPNMPAAGSMRGPMGRIPGNNCGCGPAKSSFTNDCGCDFPETSSAANARHDSMSRMPIAMAYVPWEHFTQTYELDQAIEIGTIFPGLNKPFTGRGGNCS